MIATNYSDVRNNLKK